MEEHPPMPPVSPPFSTGVDKGHYYRYEFLPKTKPSDASPPRSPVIPSRARQGPNASVNLSVDTRDFSSSSVPSPRRDYQQLPVQSPRSANERRAVASSRAQSPVQPRYIPEGKNPRVIRGSGRPAPSSDTFHSPEVDPLLGKRGEGAKQPGMYSPEEEEGLPRAPAEVGTENGAASNDDGADSEETKRDSDAERDEYVTTPWNAQVPLIPSIKSFSRGELLDNLVRGLRAVKVYLFSINTHIMLQSVLTATSSILL